MLLASHRSHGVLVFRLSALHLICEKMHSLDVPWTLSIKTTSYGNKNLFPPKSLPKDTFFLLIWERETLM